MNDRGPVCAPTSEKSELAVSTFVWNVTVTISRSAVLTVVPGAGSVSTTVGGPGEYPMRERLLHRTHASGSRLADDGADGTGITKCSGSASFKTT